MHTKYVVTPQFKLGDMVSIVCSGECGVIVGSAEYEYSDPQYLLRYKQIAGGAVEKWWDEGALRLDASKK